MLQFIVHFNELYARTFLFAVIRYVLRTHITPRPPRACGG
jgi:hypothetical protein